jgi:hypothetical protein
MQHACSKQPASAPVRRPAERLAAPARPVLHSTIVPFSSGENQLLDTHVNGPDKAGRRQAYAKVQQATIGQVLESYDGDLDAIQKQIAAGADPRLLPTWKAPIDLKIPQPSRAEVILIGRAVRAKLFGTIKGQRIIANGYYDNGLMPRGGVHCDGAEYLLYSARLTPRHAHASTAAKSTIFP